MSSLRREILLPATLILGVIGFAAAAATWRVMLFEAGQFMDDQLRQFALASGGRSSVSEEAAPSLQEPEDRYATAVWSNGGTATVDVALSGVARPTRVGFGEYVVAGEAWRGFATEGDGRTVLVAQRASARGEIARHAALEAALPILTAVPAVWIVVTLSLARVLRRLDRIGADFAARTAEAAGLVPVCDLPDEMRPLAAAVNALLERGRTALSRQRQFIADSAHQLNTPLAALQLQVDNVKAAGIAREPAEALARGVARARELVAGLLLLSRIEAGSATVVTDRVDVVELITDVLADFVDMAERRRVDLGLAASTRVTIVSDRSGLRDVLSNLIDNAVRHSSPGSRVDCTVEDLPAGVVVTVADTGPGVSEADLPRLTDRFFRSGSASGQGSGLGLAIVKAIADRNDFGLDLRNRHDGHGFIATVRISATRRADPATQV